MAEMHDSTEEYLETILEIEEEGIPPLRARLVERLGFSAAAVSEQVNRLENAGYLELAPDKQVILTDKGRTLATTMVRRHRLAERLLTDVIGLEWEKVHREADLWEHVISDDVEKKLVSLLGDPATCPHGNPIPGSANRAAPTKTHPLADLDDGKFTTTRISEKLELDFESLQLIALAKITPGNSGTVTDADQNYVFVTSVTGEHKIPRTVAQMIWVSG